jgi:3-deoxy-D-manno-octulosonic-acid transferase
MLGDVAHFAMQSAADAERIVALGASARRVSVCGNIKYDIGAADRAGLDEVAARLNAAFALDRRPLVVAGSTSDGEEEMVIAAFEKLRREPGAEHARLLIAPRHPERFDAVARLLESSRLRYVRRSAFAAEAAAQPEVAVAGAGALAAINVAAPDKTARAADVVLLDSIGELAALYRFAAAVFVGGSLMPRGGHNILEPALHAKPVIVGPHMENFREVAQEFLRRDAVIQLHGTSDGELTEALFRSLAELLCDPERARTLGENARRAVADNRGATAHTVEVVASLI